MKTKYTPGPWRIGECKTRVETISDQVNPWPTSVACASHDGPQGWANARLIAAGPDMLAALTHLNRLYEREAHTIDKTLAWGEARAAIVKAQGEEAQT